MTGVYFGHQNMKTKILTNFASSSKPLNIGTHSEALQTSFLTLPFTFNFEQFLGNFLIFWNFLKIVLTSWSKGKLLFEI
jgi:hypothetical protein